MIDNTDHIRRLTVLADFLTKYAPQLDATHRLRMERWYEIDDTPQTPDCGTAACAAGWATWCLALAAEGFHTTRRQSFDGVPYHIPAFTTDDGIERLGFDACGRFFGTFIPFSPETYAPVRKTRAATNCNMFDEPLLVSADVVVAQLRMWATRFASVM